MEVRTDLVPGREFVAVQLREPGGPVLAMHVAGDGDDWIRGARVAEIGGLSGPSTVDVHMLRAGGGIETSRRVRVTVADQTAITVVITRDCRGIQCGADDSTCYRGTCVDIACTEENRGPCVDGLRCFADDECMSASSCGAPRCIEGVCLYSADDGSCPGGEACDPTLGCAARSRGTVPASTFAARYGTAGPDGARALAVDAMGRPTVTGFVAGDADFGGGVRSGAGDSDAFVASFEPDGAHRWSLVFGSATGVMRAPERATAVAFDGADRVYVTGLLMGDVDFGGGVSLTAAGNRDGFVLALDDAGTVRWAQLVGGTDADAAFGVAVDPLGAVFATGHLNGTVDVGGTVLDSAGSFDGWLASWDLDGAPRWAQSFGGTADDTASGLTFDRAGAVVMTGSFTGDGDFGGGRIPNAAGTDGFVARYDVDGGPLVSWSVGNDSDVRPASIAVGADDAVLVGGAMLDGPLTFGPDELAAAGGDAMVLRFSPSSLPRWGRSFGGSAGDEVLDVAADAAGNFYVVGALEQTVDLGGGLLWSAGGREAFVASYDDAGAHRWSIVLGTHGHDGASAVAAGPDGCVWVAGSFDGQLDLGSTMLDSAGESDVFLVRLGP